VIRDALDYMDRQVGSFSRDWRGHYFFFYGHYYAVQAYYITGDPKWQRYFRTVKRILLDGQQGNGRWRCSVGPGDAFGTAVATWKLTQVDPEGRGHEQNGRCTFSLCRMSDDWKIVAQHFSPLSPEEAEEAAAE